MPYLNFVCDSYKGFKVLLVADVDFEVMDVLRNKYASLIRLYGVGCGRGVGFSTIYLMTWCYDVSFRVKQCLETWWMMGLCWCRWRCPIFVLGLWHPCMIHLKRGIFVQVRWRFAQPQMYYYDIDIGISSKHVPCLEKAQTLLCLVLPSHFNIFVLIRCLWN